MAPLLSASPCITARLQTFMNRSKSAVHASATDQAIVIFIALFFSTDTPLCLAFSGKQQRHEARTSLLLSLCDHSPVHFPFLHYMCMTGCTFCISFPSRVPDISFRSPASLSLFVDSKAASIARVRVRGVHTKAHAHTSSVSPLAIFATL